MSLQNGAIALIFKIGKIRNIRFAENLIMNVCEFFLMLMSLLCRHLLIEHSPFVYYFLRQ